MSSALRGKWGLECEEERTFAESLEKGKKKLMNS